MKFTLSLYALMLLAYLIVIPFGLWINNEMPILDYPARQIPKVAYDKQKNQCVLIYPDTMIVRECK